MGMVMGMDVASTLYTSIVSMIKDTTMYIDGHLLLL